ncbi:MAG: polysaccharide biosynthesis protein [Gemmatimonadetes bacterium]|nr:polysaccharide biosynthesis protein [Gemmatimonadota bacterium]
MTPELVALATGHRESRWTADLTASDARARDAYAGRRVLVIGGAGSIGSATVRALLAYAPAALHVVDQNENGLAEVARDIRGAAMAAAAVDVRLMPLDYGAAVTRRFLDAAGPYDAVLHFAALKHVRSEKDPASVLQMLDTNVVKQARLLSWLAEAGTPARYFAVSTDKAADPVNFMGASKRLMEQLLFTGAPLGGAVVTSARFANVAFSAGSLLESWSARIAKRQPLAVPRDTRRYFVSLDEAAAICLLAATAIPAGHVAVPRLTVETDLRELAPIAEGFVRAAGYATAWYDDEAEARGAVAREAARGAWPVLRTPRDTDGEKAEETFVGAHEAAVEVGLSQLRAVPQPGADAATLREVLATLSRWIDDSSVRADKGAIAACVRRVVPEFAPQASGKSLDDRV